MIPPVKVVYAFDKALNKSYLNGAHFTWALIAAMSSPVYPAEDMSFNCRFHTFLCFGIALCSGGLVQLPGSTIGVPCVRFRT